jgi:hypothetical protein
VLLSLLYIQGTIDHIAKILAKKNIKTVFKPYKTLKQIFRTTKDKHDPMLGPGFTKFLAPVENLHWPKWRTFKDMLKEHIVDTTHN